ncbi:hypothetical protein PIB30_028616 [Stylosanthes scabra]|uniref:Uncharacterized protein n=1 Tax=Stylosanthes scabra TaxID=79078 RepID=A0ABU6Y9L4_9FABA|nr:hypothetical protein [Stylosanthes scabra]
MAKLKHGGGVASNRGRDKPFLFEEVVESHASGGVECLAEDSGGYAREESTRPFCWMSLTPTVTSLTRGGLAICVGVETWMDCDSFWKASAGQRERMEVALDLP